MIEIAEEEAARQAIANLQLVTTEQEDAMAQVQTTLNSEDASVDINNLFRHYDTLYFRSLLHSRVEVSWSQKLTVCAGLCELIRGREGDDRYNKIRIKLSEPLLKYRSRSDVVNTLLHEGIHAYLFATTSWRHARRHDGTGHGDGFMLLAHAINAHGGCNVTELHEFHDEVDSYRKHVWQCDGTCKTHPPSFGVVKRMINRPPGKHDAWWEQHQKQCGGRFVKIGQPNVSGDMARSLGKAGQQKNKIDGWLLNQTRKGVNDIDAKSGEVAVWPKKQETRITEGSDPNDESATETRDTSQVVACPICEEDIPETEINEHLDFKHCL